MWLWPMPFRRHITPMQCGARFRDAFLIVFNNRFLMKFHIDFRFDQQIIEEGNGNGIEDHSKLENPSLLGHG